MSVFALEGGAQQRFDSVKLDLLQIVCLYENIADTIPQEFDLG
jgi:hypothetical protein